MGLPRSLSCVLFPAMALAGCDSAVTVRGAASKGPLLLGSTVEVATIASDGQPTGEVFRTQTENDLGEFQLPATAGTVEVEAQGYAYDEVADRLSTGTVTLRALAEVSGTADVYVNVVTHLAHDRVQALVEGGSSLADATAQAEGELVPGIGVGPPGFDPGATGTSMNLLGGDSDANAYLFAVSAVLLQAAWSEAPDDATVDATLQQLMNDLARDLADDGTISTDRLDQLQAAQSSVDVAAVEANLEARLSARGASSGAPDLDRVLDSDLDGLANDDDDDDDGDGVDAEAAGGTDCDDADPDVYPGATDPCEDGLDGDCDGADAECRWEGDIDLSEADAQLRGAAGERAGYTLAFTGDVDGDGAEDLAVGNSTSANGNLLAWVVSGPVAGVSSLAAATGRIELQRDDLYEVGVWRGADLLGDANADVVVSAPQAGGGSFPPGKVYVFAGPVSGALSTADATASISGVDGDVLGSAGSTGDLTGDGLADLVAGAPYQSDVGEWAGAAYVFAGPLASAASTADAAATLRGTGYDARLGRGVSEPADVDGDGVLDLLLAGNERVWLFVGPLAGEYRASDAAADAACPKCVALAPGDADGDGYLDLLAGAAYDTGSWVGAAWLVSGPLSALASFGAATASFTGTHAYQTFGWDAELTDFDADGFADVLVGAPDESGNGGGGAYGWYSPASGSSDASEADYALLSGDLGDSAGVAIDAADVDGDGTSDVLVASYEDDGAGSQAGVVWLLHGRGGR